jgi:hypothetical protein
MNFFVKKKIGEVSKDGRAVALRSIILPVTLSGTLDCLINYDIIFYFILHDSFVVGS